MTETHYHMDDSSISEATLALVNREIILTDGYIIDGTAQLAVSALSGMNVSVGAGSAWVRGVLYINSAAKTVTVGTADASYTRIDRIVARITWSANTLEAIWVPGTASLTPVAPALVQNTSVWDIPLCTITLPANTTTITDAMITDGRITAKTGPATSLGGFSADSVGNLVGGSKRITGLGAPTAATDADTKAARDAAIAAQILATTTGRLLKVSTLTVGTTTFTTQALTKTIDMIVVGGGGPGAGNLYGNNIYYGGNGGDGGRGPVYHLAVTGGETYAVSIGAGGIGAQQGAGTPGGDTTITIGGVTYTAGGGASGAVGKRGTEDGVFFGAGGPGGSVTNITLGGPGNTGDSGETREYRAEGLLPVAGIGGMGAKGTDAGANGTAGMIVIWEWT